MILSYNFYWELLKNARHKNNGIVQALRRSWCSEEDGAESPDRKTERCVRGHVVGQPLGLRIRGEFLEVKPKADLEAGRVGISKMTKGEGF